MTKDIPSEDTPYTIEGTAAHTLAEKCLRHGVKTWTFLDTSINGVAVTEEMCEAVQVYVDLCRSHGVGELLGPPWWIEQKIDLSPLNPPAPMFGTSDVIAVDGTTLLVDDLKYGQGVVVEVENNPQLYYYGIGALLALREIDPEAAEKITHIKLTIVQPRAPHPDGMVRSTTITRDELRAFAHLLLERARATIPDDAPLTAGPWCRFCPASGACPAQYEQAMSVAMVEFEEVEGPVALPVPDVLTDEQLREVLDKASLLEDWLRSVRSHVQGKLEAGKPFAGYKLVSKRAHRKWISDEATYQWAERQGITRDEISGSKIKSPAQLEMYCKAHDIELPPDLYAQNPSGFTMAPDYDHRPPILTGPETDFDFLPAEAESTNSTAGQSPQEES
jgi:hypothetical protein